MACAQDATLYLYARIVMAVMWTVLVFRCCCLPCILSIIAGEELSEFLTRKLSFSVSLLGTSIFSTVETKRGEDDDY